MHVLAIDTSTDICSVALGHKGSILGEDTFPAARMHLEKLLPSVYQLLSTHQLTICDLSVLIVGLGPGTFSGLRVGIATARGLSQALRIPILGAGSLEALARGICAADDTADFVLPVIDAKRKQVFYRLFHRAADGCVEALTPVACASPADLVANISSISGGPFVAAGNGVVAYHPLFTAAAKIKPLAMEDPVHDIHAGFHFAVLDDVKAPDIFSLQELCQVLPLYIREPDADKTILLRKRKPWLISDQ